MRRNAFYIFLFILGFGILIFPHISQIANNKIHQVQTEDFKRITTEFEPKQIKDKVKKLTDCNQFIYQNESALKDPFVEDELEDTFKQCKELTLANESMTDDKEEEIELTSSLNPLTNSNNSINFNSGNDYVAAIDIPKLNLEIPIYLGTSNRKLAKGVGQVEGSSLPIGGENSHTVLAGHRGMGIKEMFRNLDKLKVNDIFHIHTLAGKLEYRVYDVKVILPHETESLYIQEGRDLASLVTCHPYRSNSHRLVVQGERINE